MPKVIRCNKCGLCFPEDYITEWGRKYGHGLGPDPCCEGLSTNYHQPVYPKGQIPDAPEQLMHPLEICKGSVGMADVTAQELKDNTPVLAFGDRHMIVRAKIMRAVQMKKSPALRSAVNSFTQNDAA